MILEKTPQGQYVVKSGETLSRIASAQGRTVADLLSANPSIKNPNLIFPGQALNLSSPASGFSLPSSPTGNPTSPTPTPPPTPTTNFASALIQILKDAQGGQQAGQAGLLKQQQNITGTGLDLANTINTKNIPFLNPESIVSLRRGAINAVQPGELSVENQIKLSNQGFGNVKDLITETQDAYEKEQERIQRAKAELADAEYKANSLAETIRHNQASEKLEGDKNNPRGDVPPITPEQAKDPFIQSLLKTRGGKALTDTSIQKLDKGLTVLGQLGVLQGNIQNMKTGPIVGAFRGANPWDTNAQTIKAQLNAIVPNLARGIYGEVGVLTDNDIKTYSRTLPNLTSTDAIRNGILYITLDLIGKSIKNTLSVNAAAGRDVSGFVEIYTEMESAKNSVLSTIPGANVPKAFSGSNTVIAPDGTEVEITD